MNLLLRDSWNEAWEQAFEISATALRAADFGERCRCAGAEWDADTGVATIEMLGIPYRVSLPDFEITSDGPDPVSLRDRVFLLHYLEQASGTQRAGKWIAYEQIPDGRLYLPNFQGRVVGRLMRTFAEDPSSLVDAGLALGGHTDDCADIALVIPTLPRAWVMLQLWPGDDEFPASGNVLFDATVTEYLSAEDAVVLGELTVVAAARQGGAK